jgi:hypothetical protein
MVMMMAAVMLMAALYVKGVIDSESIVIVIGLFHSFIGRE